MHPANSCVLKKENNVKKNVLSLTRFVGKCLHEQPDQQHNAHFHPGKKKLRNDVNLGLSSAKNLISLSHPHANGKGEREWVKFRSTQNISGASQQNRGAFS